MEVLELRAQLPFQMRIDDRQRLIEQDRVDVGTHQAAAKRDLLLFIRRERPRLPFGLVAKIQHGNQFIDPPLDIGGRNTAIAQRKGEILGDRHGVVDHRKLEHLRDVALLGRQLGNILLSEQDAPARRYDQARR